MSKHTPGPWLIDVANYHAGHIATVDHNGSVIEIWSETWPKLEDAPANARLIAAAPELLEAAQAAMNCIGELPPTQARIEVALMLTGAIAKAKGEA